MVSALDSSMFLGSLCYVLGQDTLLSQYLSPFRITNEYWLIFWGNLTEFWEVTLPDGLAYHSGGSRNTPSSFILQKQELNTESCEPVGLSRLYFLFKLRNGRFNGGKMVSTLMLDSTVESYTVARVTVLIVGINQLLGRKICCESNAMDQHSI